MSLQGIPITDDQCIGDTLPILNNAFLSLDDCCHAVGLSAEDLYSKLASYVPLSSNPPKLQPTSSPTVDLFFNSQTGKLSADLAPADVAATTNSFIWRHSILGTTALPYGAPYDGLNIAYPGGVLGFVLINGGVNGLYGIESTEFILKTDSMITLTDNSYWNWNLMTGANQMAGNFYTGNSIPAINVQFSYDVSIDGSAWADLHSIAQDPSIKPDLNVIRGVSYAAPVFEMGGCGAGCAVLLAKKGAKLKFRAKFRFFSLNVGAGSFINVKDLVGHGSHIVTIQQVPSAF